MTSRFEGEEVYIIVTTCD